MAIGTNTYGPSSPYYSTPLFDGQYLDVLTYREIPKLADDKLIEIATIYDLRPNLMAYDLYGDPALWWVFAARRCFFQMQILQSIF